MAGALANNKFWLRPHLQPKNLDSDRLRGTPTIGEGGGGGEVGLIYVKT